MDGLLHFTSVPVSFSLKDLDIGHGYRVPCPKAVITYSCGVVQFTMFFEPDTQGAFRFSDVGVRRVLVTCNVVDGATFLFLWCLILGMDNFGSQSVGRLMVHVDAIVLVYTAKLFR